MSKEFKASSLFKAPGEVRAKASLGSDYFYNRSVYSKNFVKSAYRNTTNDFSQIVRNEDIKEIKLVKDYNVVDFPIQANNRVEFFYAPDGKKVDYKEITKVEDYTPSEYPSCPTCQLKNMGFTKFYQLYKVNEFNLEVKLCIMAIR